MKFFKESKRHLSKYKKAKPNIRRSAVKKRILEEQKMQNYCRMEGVRKRVAMREDRVERLGSSLIKALEWGYMRKSLRGRELEKQKEVTERWMERRQQMRRARP